MASFFRKIGNPMIQPLVLGITNLIKEAKTPSAQVG